MQISDHGPLKDLAGLLSGLQEAAQVKSPSIKEAGTPQGGEDKVQISSQAKEFQQIYQLASQAPDVRTDKVAELQEAIKGGTYNVRGEQVAAKLITQTILDAIL